MKRVSRATAAGKRVLVVDDDPDLLRALSLRVKAAGYEVSSATDGREGFERALAEDPDAIVVDMSMPEMTGLEMIAALKARTPLYDPTILLVSAALSNHSRREAKNLGVRHVLEKPFDGVALVGLIGQAIKSKLSESQTGEEQPMTSAKSALIATGSPWGPVCVARLQKLGWSASLVGDGIDTLLGLSKTRPDLLVLDLGLPGVDAEIVCMKIVGEPVYADMSILPVDDHRSDGLKARLEDAGLNVLPGGDGLPDILEGVVAAGQQEKAASAPEMIVQDPAIGRERPRLLLVDDDRDLLNALQLRFRRYDVEIETSTGGRQAIFRAAELKPDVIVTDYSMPDGNAEYFLLQLREQPSLRNTPVIVLTGWTFEGRTDAAHRRDMVGRFGAVAYLQKPVDFKRLIEEVEKHCDLSELSPAD